MTQTASQWLDSLTTLFTPLDSQFAGARTHRWSIQARLDAELGLHEMFETGSLRHGTGVWRYSDADFIVSLKGSQPASEWTMLNKVKESLQGRFTSTHIHVSRPAVVCDFSDGQVEVVPAYSAGSGYWIADPRGGWMKTYPKQHNTYVNSVNTKIGGGAKRLARQLKVWKYQRSVPVSSCYLEMRSAKYLDGESSYLQLADLHIALSKLHQNSLADMNDPTGFGSRFGACSSDSNKADALSKLSRAVTRAGKAREFANAGKNAEAIEQLKLLFNR